MEYKRTPVDGSIFGIPGEFSMLPELPMIEYKVGKWKIKITDLRCLNEQAVSTFEQCIMTAAKEKGATEAAFLIGDVSEDKIQLISDICMAIKYEARKRGGDYSGGSLLIVGVERRDDVIAFQFIKDRARAIYDYAQAQIKETGQAQISLPELVARIIEKEHEEIREKLEATQCE